MTAVSGIARMNIAAMSDEALGELRRFMAQVASYGTDEGRKVAAGYLAAIDDETELRIKEPI